MKYQVDIERTALKSLEKLPLGARNKVIKSIESLSADPRPVGAKKLSGRDGWRIRIGNYRVIYEIRDKVCYILVLDIAHRKEIYRYLVNF
jgi:mRNA interferase RelE/StbE